MSENEKSSESVGDILSSIVRSVGEVVSDVIETVEEGVQALLNPEESEKEKTEKTDQAVSEETTNQVTTNEETNSEKIINEETRVGYLPSLPQAEEPEEEAVSEPAAGSDAKNEIEAAIAKARETNSEAAEPEAAEKDELVSESLPELPSTNTAKLYIQSPNRVFLYWNLSGNPFETLQKAFGNRANNYQLVTKLINLQTNAESFAPANPGGNWWYNVRSDTAYRVDLGFYAANRPFIRLLSSNSINTPRAAPSLRADTEEDWIISTKQFVQVLATSGYSHDALGVAFGASVETGGDISEDASTLVVANRFAPLVYDELDLAELRWLLVSLAAGTPFADLQSLLSPATLTWLRQVLTANPDALGQENVRTVLESIFGSEFVEIFTDENAVGWMRLAPVAIGASAINFPEVLFPQLRLPELRAALVETPFGEQSGAEAFPQGEFFTSSAEFIK